jgi:hypothetical protein
MSTAMRAAVLSLALIAGSSASAEDADELAKQLANPIASLTSVPFQYNYAERLGPAHTGVQSRLNVQPVVPVAIGENWDLISRTILPLVRQDDLVPGAGRQSGTGDIVQSFFFSPKAPTRHGWSWGAGPVFLLATASDPRLGGERWGAGPTFVALRQTPGGWTYGVLANHLASVAGNDTRPDVNATFLQPFLSKRIGPGRTLSTNFESTYDWVRAQWNAPLNVGVSQVLPIGRQMVSFQVGGAWYVEASAGAPHWSARFTVTLLYERR